MPAATWWWNPQPLDRAVRSWATRVLREACQHLEFGIESLIAIQGVPVARRSDPGEPPRRETGDLIRSWTYAVSTSSPEAWVYSPLDYSYYLEVGAAATYGIILPRPYIRRAQLAAERTLAIILTQPMP
jgi:hypothetical protein